MLIPTLCDKIQRVERLRHYHVLGPESDPVFDDFTRLASEICHTPIARVTFSDTENYWFKSTIGLENSDQDAGCCSHAILGYNFFEVPDTLKDKRCMSKDWVHSSPGIRYYAAAPLVSRDEVIIGTICVMDHEVRCLTTMQREGLQSLARLLINNLESMNRQDVISDKNGKRKETESELEQASALLNATLESTTDGILVVDQEGKILRFNHRFVKMWHIPEPVLASGDNEIILYLSNLLKEPEQFLQKITDLSGQSDDSSCDVLKLKNGKVFERYSHSHKVGEKKVGQIWSFKDMTELHEQAALLRHRTLYDALTNLPNRVLFLDRIQQAILLGRREIKSFAVLLMDIDRFKEVNDTLGHRYGDILLQQISERLSGLLRKSDTLARMGGDEFAILLLGSKSVEGTIRFSEKILKILEGSFDINGVTLDISISIGIALFPDHGDQAHLLLQRADVAMYVAKTADNKVSVYTASQDRYSLKRLVLKNDLRHAINHDQLFLHFQAKVSLQTNEIMGVEALVRWKHPQFGNIQPDQFIPLAEQSRLIKPLTFWVLEKAIEQSMTWQKAGLNIPVAVNLSVCSLRDIKLMKQIVALLEVFGMLPEKLELEITESIIMDDPGRAMEIVTGLGKMGVRFAIDDFGTGYSSLSYLKRLPVQSIKIDKSFIQELVVEGHDEVIVLSIIELARNLGMKVIAEGIEDQPTWDRLCALGCHEAQGYFISRPLPSDEIALWYEAWTQKHPRKILDRS